MTGAFAARLITLTACDPDGTVGLAQERMIGRKLVGRVRGRRFLAVVGQGRLSRQMAIARERLLGLHPRRLVFGLAIEHGLMGHQGIDASQIAGRQALVDRRRQGACIRQRLSRLIGPPLGQPCVPDRLAHPSGHLPAQESGERLGLLAERGGDGLTRRALSRHPERQLDHRLPLVGAIVGGRLIAQVLDAQSGIAGHQAGGLTARGLAFVAKRTDPRALAFQIERRVDRLAQRAGVRRGRTQEQAEQDQPRSAAMTGLWRVRGICESMAPC
jgi:hypothetical protein